MVKGRSTPSRWRGLTVAAAFGVVTAIVLCAGTVGRFSGDAAFRADTVEIRNCLGLNADQEVDLDAMAAASTDCASLRNDFWMRHGRRP